MSKSTILAWHFVGAALRDGRPVPPDGKKLVHRGEVVPCESGLHASERLIDALQYAPGDTLCRVSMGGTIIRAYDKLAASRRTILWRIDAVPVLRQFARQCALDVSHLWDMPATVRTYLETGDETLRAAARDAARDAAWDAARDVARDVARAAARAAARDAAWDAARDAARAAARDAARDAAWDAARATARAAARDAAWDAAWDATRDAQNERLEALVMAARPSPVTGN